MIFKKVSFYLATLGILAAMAMVIKLNSKEASPPPPFQPAVNPYENTVAATGIVEGRNENISLGVPVSGIVAEVKVKVWDKVKKDQPLFSIDARSLQAQLEVQRANVQVAEAQLVKLKDQLRRWRSVNDPRAVSKDELQTRENEVLVAQAQLKSTKAQVQMTQIEMDRLIVRAPRDGVILQSNIRPGEYAAGSGMEAAMVLGDLDQLQIRADVDEQNAARVKFDQPATAYLKGTRTDPIALKFMRIEPMVVPKRSLTGSSSERVDTRVLQVIYAIDEEKNTNKVTIYVGQQVDVFIDSPNLNLSKNKGSK